MLRQTLDRLGDLVPNERRLIVTNKRLTDAVRQQLPELPAAAVVGEPCKRDTAACIGLAALLVSRNDPDATMAVCRPTMSLLPPTNSRLPFVWPRRCSVARASIVTLVSGPVIRQKVFGYIRRGTADRFGGHVVGGDLLARPDVYGPGIQRKTQTRHGQEILASGEYYWNSGIFHVARGDDSGLRSATARRTLMRRLDAIEEAWDGQNRDAVFEREFAASGRFSIDFARDGARQGCGRSLTRPFQWDDLGGWAVIGSAGGKR